MVWRCEGQWCSVVQWFGLVWCVVWRSVVWCGWCGGWCGCLAWRGIQRGHRPCDPSSTIFASSPFLGPCADDIAPSPSTFRSDRVPDADTFGAGRAWVSERRNTVQSSMLREKMLCERIENTTPLIYDCGLRPYCSTSQYVFTTRRALGCQGCCVRTW